jgi:hypothetical protein
VYDDNTPPCLSEPSGLVAADLAVEAFFVHEIVIWSDVLEFWGLHRQREHVQLDEWRAQIRFSKRRAGNHNESYINLATSMRLFDVRGTSNGMFASGWQLEEPCANSVWQCRLRLARRK